MKLLQRQRLNITAGVWKTERRLGSVVQRSRDVAFSDLPEVATSGA